jgi:hypothetical protein
VWNTQTSKLQAFSASAEVANTTTIASVTLTVRVTTQR